MNLWKQIQRDYRWWLADIKRELYELGEQGSLEFDILKSRFPHQKTSRILEWISMREFASDPEWEAEFQHVEFRFVLFTLLKLAFNVILSARQSR